MRVLAVASCIAIAVASAGLLATGMSINLASMVPMATLFASQLALAVYCRARGLTALTPAVEVICVFLAANFALLPISYIAMRFGMPIADPGLIALDAMLGFDWLHFVARVGESRLLSWLLEIAYVSFGAQLFLLPVYFALLNRCERSYAMVVAYILIVTCSSAVAAFFPAEGAFVAYAADQATIGHVDPHFGYAFLAEFDSVRTAERFEMSLDRVQGLLTFPSVHVAVAVLCLWTAAGSRLLFPLFLVLDSAMAVSAVTHGGHYLVDVIGGVLVAIVAIRTATLLFPRTDRAVSRRAEGEIFQSGWKRLLARHGMASTGMPR
jgi:membrane-associated phospholipid phosphatase